MTARKSKINDMSWSAQWASAHVNDLDNVPPSFVSPGVLDDTSPETREAYEVGRKTAIELIKSRVVGDDSNKFTVSLSGHVNPGHVPAKGWANDYIGVQVVQLSP